MAVHIRLSRRGAKKSPFYRVVATDLRKSRDGGIIEQLGVFDPNRPEFLVNAERMKYWLGTGAKPSDVVFQLWKKLQRQNVKTVS